MSHSVVNISQSIDNDNKSDEKIDYLNLVQIKCKCEESNLDEDELYICKYKECNHDFYCADCGPYYHNFISKKKRKNHRFQLEGLKNNENILALSQLLTKEQDITKFNMAQKQLIALIGVKKYNQIKTYIEKPIVLVSSNLPMAIQLGYELQEFFKSVQESVQEAVMAHKAAQNATTAASQALTAYNEAPEKIWQRWFAWDYNVEWDYILNPEKANLKSNLELATAVEADRLKKANDALNGTLNGTVSIKKAMKVGAIGMAIATTIEMGIHAYRWKTGQISGKEWCRLLGRSLVKNTASMVGTAVGGQGGAILGCKLGVSIGTAINPVLGTMVGGVVGVVGGILFGYLMGKGAEAVYDQVFSEIKSEEKQKEKLLQEALLYFNFQPKDIRNSKIFNEKRLKKIFKQRALFAHPDRRDGDHSEWYRLSTYYGYLKALLEQNETNKEMVEKSMEKMQSLQYN